MTGTDRFNVIIVIVILIAIFIVLLMGYIEDKRIERLRREERERDRRRIAKFEELIAINKDWRNL